MNLVCPCYFALTGLLATIAFTCPRALPWAAELCPFGAAEFGKARDSLEQRAKTRN
jgi:hypothetical protein